MRADTDPAALGDVDLLIIATKATAVEHSAKLIAGHFPSATVMTVQNGLGCKPSWPVTATGRSFQP